MAVRGIATKTSEQGQKAANSEKGTLQSFPLILFFTKLIYFNLLLTLLMNYST